jgi:hypothetical protein
MINEVRELAGLKAINEEMIEEGFGKTINTVLLAAIMSLSAGIGIVKNAENSDLKKVGNNIEYVMNNPIRARVLKKKLVVMGIDDRLELMKKAGYESKDAVEAINKLTTLREEAFKEKNQNAQIIYQSLIDALDKDLTVDQRNKLIGL